MLIRSLTLENIRNLEPIRFAPGPRFNVFAGENGQGKTNLLESLYVASALRSFRTTRLAEILRLGAESARIRATVSRADMEREVDIAIRQRSKTVRLDGKAVRPLSRYFGHFNAVLFAPEDLQIPRGSPGSRRRFLDRSVFTLHPEYLAEAQRYDRALKSRNALLRDARAGASNPGVLEVYDRQLGPLGARVAARRAAFLRELAPRFRRAFGEITRAGLSADLRYESAVDTGEDGGACPGEDTLARRLEEALRNGRARDRARGATTIGPHRDDLTFLLDGQPAQRYASQGQLRALVLAWKTAEIELFAAAQGEYPLFLLDDVSSELDAARNAYLFEVLAASRSQCFITTTHPKHVLLSAERRDFSIRAGAITRQDSA